MSNHGDQLFDYFSANHDLELTTTQLMDIYSIALSTQETVPRKSLEDARSARDKAVRERDEAEARMNRLLDYLVDVGQQVEEMRDQTDSCRVEILADKDNTPILAAIESIGVHLFPLGVGKGCFLAEEQYEQLLSGVAKFREEEGLWPFTTKGGTHE